MVISVMYYVFQKISAICYQSIKLLIQVKVKLTLTPHQVVIKDFKNPQNILATGTVDDIDSLFLDQCARLIWYQRIWRDEDLSLKNKIFDRFLHEIWQ